MAYDSEMHAELETLRRRLESFIEEIAELREFRKTWDENDGNTPGYNLQKARGYGKQAHFFKQLFEVWRKASMTLKPLTSVSLHGEGNQAFAAARRLEKKLVNEWPEIFPENVAVDPVNRMDAIEEANLRARNELNLGSTPSHDGYFMGQTPVCDLTTEQLRAEIDRREGNGPFQKMFVFVRVTGTLSNGMKKEFLHWEYQDVDPESFSASSNADFLDLKVKRLKK